MELYKTSQNRSSFLMIKKQKRTVIIFHEFRMFCKEEWFYSKKYARNHQSMLKDNALPPTCPVWWTIAVWNTMVFAEILVFSGNLWFRQKMNGSIIWQFWNISRRSFAFLCLFGLNCLFSCASRPIPVKIKSEKSKKIRIVEFSEIWRSAPPDCAAGRENGSIWIAPIDQKWWVLPWYKFSLKSAASRGLPQIVSVAGRPLNSICYILRNPIGIRAEIG